MTRHRPDESLLVLDSGNLLFRRAPLSPGESQEKITARGILNAYSTIGFDAVAIGPLDLAAGIDFLKDHNNARLPWISANLLNEDDSPVFDPFIIKKTGQFQTGIIGLTNKDVYLPKNLHIADWRTILPAQLSILSKKCSHIILLSNLPERENNEIASAYPNLQILLSVDPKLGNLSPAIINNTLITQTTNQGKYLGVLTIHWGQDKGWKIESGNREIPGSNGKENEQSTFTSRFIALNSSIPDSPDIVKIVKEVQQQILSFNKALQQNAANAMRENTSPIKQPTKGFIGYEQCGACHRVQTAFWRSTRHAMSYATLVKSRQEQNPECLVCHVTHERPLFTSDPADARELLALPSSMQAVGCEVCHGPGEAHARAPEQNSMNRRVEQHICLDCHTKERDPQFNFDNKIKAIRCPKG